MSVDLRLQVYSSRVSSTMRLQRGGFGKVAPMGNLHLWGWRKFVI